LTLPRHAFGVDNLPCQAPSRPFPAKAAAPIQAISLSGVSWFRKWVQGKRTGRPGSALLSALAWCYRAWRGFSLFLPTFFLDEESSKEIKAVPASLKMHPAPFFPTWPGLTAYERRDPSRSLLVFYLLGNCSKMLLSTFFPRLRLGFTRG